MRKRFSFHFNGSTSDYIAQGRPQEPACTLVVLHQGGASKLLAALAGLPVVRGDSRGGRRDTRRSAHVDTLVALVPAAVGCRPLGTSFRRALDKGGAGGT